MASDMTRSAGSAADAVEAQGRTAAPAQHQGDLSCTAPGCADPTGLGCEYTDRQSRTCPTAWCPEHRLVIEERVYCRRHAGIVSALPGGHAGHVAPMPDLENRAPSLVSWVAREVDAEIRQLMLAGSGESSGVQLLTDPVYLIFTGRGRRRAWERAWKRVENNGHSLRVSLIVEEDAQAEVAVRVNADLVERIVPPWIVQRLYGAAPPPEVDAQRRRDFNRRLLDAARMGLGRQKGVAGPNDHGGEER